MILAHTINRVIPKKKEEKAVKTECYNRVVTEERFVEALSDIGLGIDATQLGLFSEYQRLLIAENTKYNLTSLTGAQEVYAKHFFDSLLVLADRNLNGRLLDVGSGAGFPGIPLKIMRPELEVMLCDPSIKKTRFMSKVISELQLEGIECITARAEALAKTKRENYDYVLSRAVAPLAILSELCLPLVRVNGEFGALKGPKALDELAVAEKGIEVLGGEVEEVCTHYYQNQKRINIWVAKVTETPMIFPRPYSRIRKQPL